MEANVEEPRGLESEINISPDFQELESLLRSRHKQLRSQVGKEKKKERKILKDPKWFL